MRERTTAWYTLWRLISQSRRELKAMTRRHM